MKFNFKKIASVLATTVMLSSTVAFAAAAWPAPLVNSGAADAALVVGASAASTDMAAATSVADALNAKVTTTGAVSATEGDAVLIKSGTDNLNLNNALSIIGTINDEDMETFLASGEYKDINKAEFTYDQTITVASTNVEYSTSSAYKDKTPTIGLFYEKDADVLSYSIDYNGLNFTRSIGTDLPIMGNMYYVLDYDTTDGLTLLDSSSSAVISEGETKTLTVDGKSYEVTLDFVGDSSPDFAKFTVNGESTDKIDEGDDEELVDGSYLAVKEVLYSSKESGTSSVEFTIGKGKLVLPPSGEVEMNDDRVINVDSTVDYTNGVLTIDWNTDAKTVLTEAGNNLVLPGFETIKVTYSGMTFPDTEKTVLDAAGVLELETVVKDGPVTIPLVNYDNLTIAGNVDYIGEDSDSKLVLGSASTTNSSVQLLDIGDYFVATYASGDEYESYVYQLDSVKLNSDGKTEVVLNNLASNDATDDITFADIGRSRTKGEVTFTLNAADETTENVTIYVSGTAISTRKLATEKGLSIDLTNLNTTNNFTSGVTLTFDEQDKDKDFEDGAAFNVTLKQTADENIQVSTTTVATLETKTDDVYVGYVLSDLATKVELDKTDADAQNFVISYTGEEVKADVYVSAGSATFSGSDSIKVYKDTEVDAIKSKNLVVIGGSCINTVAAKLLGSDTPVCGAAFSAKTTVGAGQYLLKVAASPYNAQKVALLIAGYEAADTKTAADLVAKEGTSMEVGETVGPKTA